MTSDPDADFHFYLLHSTHYRSPPPQPHTMPMKKSKKLEKSEKAREKAYMKEYDKDGYPKLPPPVHSLAVKLASDISSSSSPDDPCLPDPQTSSPLFTKLPPELRNRIFFLALLEHDNTSRPVPFHSLAYRPTHPFARSISGLPLLQTCKLIYLSFYLVPVETTIHDDYACFPLVDNDHIPFRRAKPSAEAFASMTVQQREAVQTIQVYTRQGFFGTLNWGDCVIYLSDVSRIDSGYSRLRSFVEGQVRPTKLIVTVRHHDWKEWRGDKALEMSEFHTRNWKRESFWAFGDRLREIVIELETTEERKDELESIVEDVRKWRITVREDREFVTDGMEVERKVWEGQKFGTDPLAPLDKSARQKYYVAIMRWREEGNE